ncbi:MAG: HNH endonuclease [Bacteroidaceae bacterium]|nr:HNH endonuclease [Bacteroidaceae bacterium]
MVYVLSVSGQPLMPTKNHAKVRVLLKEGRAKVINRCPFTIQLLYESTAYTQNISLGIDAGSKHIGLSATDEARVYFEAEALPRTDIVELLSTRRELRKSRRNRKTRYRQPRFNNRVHSKNKGWLAPSVQARIDTHLTMVSKVIKMLPISNVKVEVASFDLQKLKADIEGLKRPEGTDYQQGEQRGFWNAREYVLFRDGYICQCCKGKSKDKVLNVHHIQSRKVGGNAPNNLITLCEYCHKQYHLGNIKLPKKIKRGVSFKDATFMGIMRWALYNRLKEIYTPLGIDVKLTYGYITKNTRIEHNLPKDHYIDARCISGNPDAISDGMVYAFKKVRCHNRQIHKCTIGKGNIRKRNQLSYEVKGFRLYDKVLYKGQECFIFGRRAGGRFAVRLLDGTKLNEQISYKKLKFLEPRKNIICERRTPLFIGAV